MKKKEAKTKLPDEVMDIVTVALSEYFGDKLQLSEYSHDNDDEWLYHVKTDWLYNNRGIFGRVISRYYIDATVVQHKFVSGEDYRNGKVFGIHPHLSWEHYGGGTNGHDTEDQVIIVNKVIDHWYIEKTLR